MRFNKQRYAGEPPLTSGPRCLKCGSPQTWLFSHTTEPPPSVYACDFCGHAWRVAEEKASTTHLHYSANRRSRRR